MKKVFSVFSVSSVFFVFSVFFVSKIFAQKVVSPNGQISIEYKDGAITVTDAGNTYIQSAAVGMTITKDGKQVKNPVKIELRAYDNGVAYRFVSKLKGEYTVESEQADFQFTQDYNSWFPHSTNYEKPQAMAFQATFDVAPISEQGPQLAFLPLAIDCGTAKLTLLESDLNAYPGMFVTTEGPTIKGWFAKYPKEMAYYRWRGMSYVKDTEDYIARCNGPRTFPWRIIAIAHDDTEMTSSSLVYSLAEPSRLSDTSWIRPGRVSWDWWNDWGLQGVPFKAGINTATYKYHIDFASRYGLEYIILDEGWYDSSRGDIMNAIPAVDLPALIEYGRQKNVGIILWTVFNVLDEHLDEACQKYSAMGAKGFKVDFMDRNDQTAVEMTYRIAEACARHHLLLDYHGIYSPAGLNITYPNVLNFEAVFGMEEAKWTERGKKGPVKDMPLYDVTFPFIRAQAGPTDFTPGGMRNASKADFQPVYSNPMTMGTRCHQMAHYIVHESPLTMFADAPSAYEKEPECTAFLASLPAQYSSMKCLQGKIGEYIVMMRTDNDGNYYIGVETNWDERDISLSFDFLPQGSYKAVMFSDGPNANHTATDWQCEEFIIPDSSFQKSLHLASGGGAVIKIEKR